MVHNVKQVHNKIKKNTGLLINCTHSIFIILYKTYYSIKQIYNYLNKWGVQPC